VSKKFFSFIHGGAVDIAPETKVIPAKDFSTLLDAKGVLKKVQEDAIAYRKEVIDECEKLKEKARQEGYEAGFQEWAEHILKFEEEIKAVRGEYAKVLAPVALKATQKIVGKAFEMSSDAIYAVVENALKPVLQHKRISIFVNKEDFATLEKKREKLKQLFENIEVLSIRERDDISQGGCVIETEGGIINARLENQWVVLEKAFQSLMREIVLHEKKEAKKSNTVKELTEERS
jgi:type III secretion protein L